MTAIAKTIVGSVLAVALMQEPVLATDLAKDFDPTEGRCRFQTDDEAIKSELSRLDHIDRVLPIIPSEEENYLKAENAATRKMAEEDALAKRPDPQLDQRISSVQARPLYHVWQVRLALAEATEALSNVLVPNGIMTYKNVDAEKLDRAIRSDYLVRKFERELKTFLDQVNWGRSSVKLSQGRYQLLSSESVFFGMDLSSYESCKLARIIGRQPFPWAKPD